MSPRPMNDFELRLLGRVSAAVDAAERAQLQWFTPHINSQLELACELAFEAACGESFKPGKTASTVEKKAAALLSHTLRGRERNEGWERYRRWQLHCAFLNVELLRAEFCEAIDRFSILEGVK